MGLKLFVFAFVFVFVFSSMFLYVYLYSQEKWAPQCTGTGAGKKGLGGLTGGRSTESCITSIAPTTILYLTRAQDLLQSCKASLSPTLL